MLAILDLWDFALIALIVALLGGGSVVYSHFKPSDAARMRRLEAKVDLILKHLGLQYEGPTSILSDEVKTLADDPDKKIAAIKLLREQTGLGLKEAKDAVEEYIAGRG